MIKAIFTIIILLLTATMFPIVMASNNPILDKRLGKDIAEKIERDIHIYLDKYKIDELMRNPSLYYGNPIWDALEDWASRIMKLAIVLFGKGEIGLMMGTVLIIMLLTIPVGLCAVVESFDVSITIFLEYAQPYEILEQYGIIFGGIILMLMLPVGLTLMGGLFLLGIVIIYGDMMASLIEYALNSSQQIANGTFLEYVHEW